MTRRAAFYSVLTLGAGARGWQDHATITDRDQAIGEARRILDTGGARAAVVQGRGTPDRPTPRAEVVVYRGIAAGYVAPPAWPVGTFERRPAPERKRRTRHTHPERTLAV